MGLGPVWTLREAAGAAAPPEAVATAAATSVGVPRAQRIAAMDWDELERSVAGCTRVCAEPDAHEDRLRCRQSFG